MSETYRGRAGKISAHFGDGAGEGRETTSRRSSLSAEAEAEPKAKFLKLCLPSEGAKTHSRNSNRRGTSA
jgi:hypothetical protein